MIHSFSVENFYSIGEKIEVDFEATEAMSSKSSYRKSANRTTVSLVEAIIGPNASGKTNVLKTLAFMKYLVVRAYKEDPSDEIPVKPFGIKGTKKPTKLSVAFSIENRIFVYDIELTRERILTEIFNEKSRAKERVTTKQLFYRKWNGSTDSYDFQDKVFGVTKDELRANSTVVATAYRSNNPLATLVAQYWRDCVQTNVNERGYEVHNHLMHAHMANHAIEYFFDHPELKERVERLLCKYDIGFGAFTSHTDEIRETTYFGIEHTFEKDTFELPLEYESSGTTQLIFILRSILIALDKGGIAVIDELDENLHPDIVEEIISMFKSKELNPRQAQIIFSSHTPIIIASLDKYQIVLVRKNSKGQSEVWRLDSIKPAVRADDNFYLKYVSGTYGALPDIG